MNITLFNNKKNLIIIIIIICLFITYKYNQSNKNEYFTTDTINNEAIQNISSLYNTQEMKLSNLTVTNNIKSENINANNIITSNTRINGTLTVSGSIMINNNIISSDSSNNLLITDTSKNTYLFKDGLIRTSNVANDSMVAILLDFDGKSSGSFVADTFIELLWYGYRDNENGVIIAPGYEVLLWDYGDPLDSTKLKNALNWKQQGWREMNMSSYTDDIIKVIPTSIYKNNSNKWYFFNFNNSSKNNGESSDRMNCIWVRRLTSYISAKDGNVYYPKPNTDSL